MTFNKLSATALPVGANTAQALKPTTVDFDEVNVGVVTENNQFLDNDTEEIQKLKQEISILKKDSINLNQQIQEAKNNENKKEQIRLIQEKKFIQIEIKLKEDKLKQLLIPDDILNQNTQYKKSFSEKIVPYFNANFSETSVVRGLKYIRKIKRRVSEPISFLGLVPVSYFVDSSLERKRISQLVSRLGIGVLLATAVTVAAKPAQAASFTTYEDIKIDFDEYDVSLDEKDNPLKDGNPSINELWKHNGLTMSSDVKKLWLYNSNCMASGANEEDNQFKNNICTGGDPDLATGTGTYKKEKNKKTQLDPNADLERIFKIEKKSDQIKELKKLEQFKDLKDLKKFKKQDNQFEVTYTYDYYDYKYNSPKQGNVLIIQENDTGGPDDYADRENPGTITFDFTDNVGVLFDSISLLDFDDPGDPIFSAVLADGTIINEIIYNGDSFEEKNGKDGDINTKRDNIFRRNSRKDSPYIKSMKVLSTNWDETEYVEGDNSLRKYNFDFSGQAVTQFSIKLPGSGAITGLKYRRRVPEPTSILGLAAVGGLAASSLKRKRKSSDSELTQ